MGGQVMRWILGVLCKCMGICQHKTIIHRRNALGFAGFGCFHCGKWFQIEHLREKQNAEYERRVAEAVEVAELEEMVRQ